MHYYQFNIGDYRRQTHHLTIVEHGIYRSLLDTYYLDECPLCKDVTKIMRSHSVRTADEQEALKNVLSDFFELTDDGYTHKTCDENIAKYQAKSEKARLSAKARWDKDANALQTDSDGNANHKPLTKNQEPETNTKTPSTEVDNRPLEIFTYWKEVMGKNNSAKPTAKRMSCIKARLKEGYSIERIKLAIDGCRGSAYHRGDNEQAKIYDDLTLICRSGDKVEQFEGYLTVVPHKDPPIPPKTTMEQHLDTSWADKLMGYEPDNGIIEHE